MLEHIKKLFGAMVLLSCFTSFQRADYNLPIFAFAIFLWDYKHPDSQKARLYYLITFTWIVDFIWLIYWGATWNSQQYKQNGSSGSSTFVMVVSIFSFILKFAIILILFFMQAQCKLAIKNIFPNLKSVFSGNSANEYSS